MKRILLVAVILLVSCKLSQEASYINRRRVNGEKLLLHRKMTQGPSLLVKREYIVFPEMCDVKYFKPKLITGIEIVDLEPRQRSSAKVTFGGINYSFARIDICSSFQKGYSYDIKIFGI